MADSEALKILDGIWAIDDATGRILPENATPAIVRAQGFGPAYSSTDTPERGVMNQILCEQYSAAFHLMTHGGILPYDATKTNYPVGATTKTLESGVLTVWKCVTANGPDSTVVSPLDSGQTAWEQLSGEVGIPDAPDAPRAFALRGELLWSWHPNSDNGSDVTHWEFQHRVEGAAVWAQGPDQTTPFRRQSNLANGVTREARVRAVSSVGKSPWSSVGTATPTAGVPSGGHQFGLRATAKNAQVLLEWGEPDTGGSPITGYTWQWKSGAQSYESGRQGTGTELTATVSGLVNGTTYTFRIRATSSAGDGPWSDEVAAMPTFSVPSGGASFNLSARPLGSGGDIAAFRLAWDPPETGGSPIIGFTYQYKLNSAISWVNGRHNPLHAGTTSFDVTALHANSTYNFRVRAENDVGTGLWSNVATATFIGD